MIQLLTVLFPIATIYLFDSRARGDHTERSDIDLANKVAHDIQKHHEVIRKVSLDSIEK